MRMNIFFRRGTQLSSDYNFMISCSFMKYCKKIGKKKVAPTTTLPTVIVQLSVVSIYIPSLLFITLFVIVDYCHSYLFYYV